MKYFAVYCICHSVLSTETRRNANNPRERSWLSFGISPAFLTSLLRQVTPLICGCFCCSIFERQKQKLLPFSMLSAVKREVLAKHKPQIMCRNEFLSKARNNSMHLLSVSVSQDVSIREVAKKANKRNRAVAIPLKWYKALSSKFAFRANFKLLF